MENTELTTNQIANLILENHTIAYKNTYLNRDITFCWLLANDVSDDHIAFACAHCMACEKFKDSDMVVVSILDLNGKECRIITPMANCDVNIQDLADAMNLEGGFIGNTFSGVK